MKLTIKSITALKLPPGKTDHIEFDDAIPGFGIRLREGGSRTWVFQYTLGSKQRRMAIGKASALTPEKARSIAADLHAKVRLGCDPATEKEAAKVNAALSFKSIADRFLARQRTRLRPRSYVEVERHLLNHAKPLHGTPIAAVDRRLIAARLGEIADAKGAVTANRSRATWSALYSWAMKEGLAESNPVANTNKQSEQSRERVLSDCELAQIWHACLDDDYGRIIRLLLLTGCRLNEIAGLRLAEIDFEKRMISLPPERVKNKREHLVPMSDAVSGILEQAKINVSDLLFGYGENRPFSGWTKAKEKLDARVEKATGTVLPHWTPHDLRRTCATRMAELGVQPHLVEAVLNHVSGHKHGVAGIYNRATYAAEKRQALGLWAAHVNAIVAGNQSSNVVMLRASGGA
jgi:integrase